MKTIEMVFKEMNELPSSFKFLVGYIPEYREKVNVLGNLQNGEELYLEIKFGKSNRAVLNNRHFRTVAQDKLRERLLKLPRTENIDKLLKTL